MDDLELERLRMAYAFGWLMAAAWAGRDDLSADIDSPQYIIDRDGVLVGIACTNSLNG